MKQMSSLIQGKRTKPETSLPHNTSDESEDAGGGAHRSQPAVWSPAMVRGKTRRRAGGCGGAAPFAPLPSFDSGRLASFPLVLVETGTGSSVWPRRGRRLVATAPPNRVPPLGFGGGGLSAPEIE